MSHKSPLAVSHILRTSAAERLAGHFQPTVAKSSISKSVRWFAAISQHNWEHNHCIVTNLGGHNSVTKRSASLHETHSFSVAATKGWAGCNHNAKQVNRTVALRNLLLAGTGWLEYPKGMAGMDSWKLTCPTNLLLQWVTFWEHLQLKGWHPHFQPTVAKSSISKSVRWLAAISQHKWEHNHCIVTNLGKHNSVTKPSASLHQTGSFL